MCYEGDDHRDENIFLQKFCESCDDLTTDFPNGASSIIIEEDTGRWQVFTEVNFGGVTAILDHGKNYQNLEQMGLQEPVKSFRVATSEVLS